MAPRVVALLVTLAAAGCAEGARETCAPAQGAGGAADSGRGDTGAPRDSDADSAGPDNGDTGPTDTGESPPCEDLIPVEGDPLAAMGRCGRLVYAPYANRDEENAAHHVPDFSWAGFEQGGVPLPAVATTVTVSPESGDDRERIQAAIDAVSALAPDASGYRGAVLLTAGTYKASAPIRITVSGVVLRGEGQGEDGTTILATAAEAYTLIEVAGGDAPAPVAGTETDIVTPYVPVGAVEFEVDDASAFSPGDRVAVRRTPNDAWIRAVGMDDYGWDADDYDIAHERTIVGVSGDVVTIDIPLVDAMETDYGGGRLERLDAGARIDHVGIEDLRLDSDYDGDTDEDHAWTAIQLSGVEDSWVRRVTALHFARAAVSVTDASRFVTVEDAAMLDPISEIDGGRRYPFEVDSGFGVLFERLYARNGRHNFSTGSRVTGPHVWLDCLAEEGHADDGPHHRWATGLLFDNVRTNELRVQNRADSGSGHGWSGAQVMFWNDDVTDTFVSDAPPAAMNWVVGVTGDEGDGQWAPEEPPGIQESLGSPVAPRSLYLQQLADRLGADAVVQVTTEAQRDGRIWDALSDWAGAGPPPW